MKHTTTISGLFALPLLGLVAMAPTTAACDVGGNGVPACASDESYGISGVCDDTATGQEFHSTSASVFAGASVGARGYRWCYDGYGTANDFERHAFEAWAYAAVAYASVGVYEVNGECEVGYTVITIAGGVIGSQNADPIVCTPAHALDWGNVIP